MKKLISLLLVLALVLSFAACGGNTTSTPEQESNSAGESSASEETPEEPESGDEEGEEPETDAYTGPDWEAIDAMDYESASEELYFYHLGDYYDLLQKGKAEVDNNSIRWALLAQAAAKLEESSLMLPGTADGGNFAISRIVPRTDASVSWGLDNDRYGYIIVANDFLSPAQRTEVTKLWSDAASETEFYTAVKDWMAKNNLEQVDEYNLTIAGDGPQTWDVLATSRVADSQYIAPTYSPLLRYDGKNELQPALAETYDVSEDGTVYTFHLRDGLTWVDQQGREVAPLTAEDFVTGLQHCADFPDELGYLLSSDGGCGIKNWDAYVAGEITDFAEVGVKAVDEKTVEYTLDTKCPFFLTMLGYGCFAPMNKAYFESQGGKFGAELDPAAADYVYGTDPSHIAYCGEFLITNYTQGTVLQYAANPTYWDAANLNVHNVSYIWYDADDVLAPFNGTIGGTYSGCGLNANAVIAAKDTMIPDTDKNYFDEYAYVSATGSTSYVGFYNINRAAFANTNDDTKLVSTQTEEEAARTREAMNNVHFRRALNYGTDRAALNAATVGEDLKSASLINMYVPGNFVQLEEDVTIDMGDGTEQTFTAGTYFGEIVQAQLDFDGLPVKVWDPTMDDGAGSSGGFDGWYNVDNAKAEMAIAIEELKQVGVEISAEHPIQIDYPYWQSNENYANKANAYKQTVEASFDGEVVVNLVGGEQMDWYYAGYYTNAGNEANYDMYDLSGWGPDYRDPATFLDTYLPYGSGYMMKCCGIF